jgi:hypothetical protein
LDFSSSSSPQNQDERQLFAAIKSLERIFGKYLDSSGEELWPLVLKAGSLEFTEKQYDFNFLAVHYKRFLQTLLELLDHELPAIQVPILETLMNFVKRGSLTLFFFWCFLFVLMIHSSLFFFFLVSFPFFVQNLPPKLWSPKPKKHWTPDCFLQLLLG